MHSTNKGFYSLCIPLLTLLLLLTGCEDPGGVGGEFVDKSELTTDTLSISSIQPVSYTGYTGRLNFLTMGRYSDPLFGELEAVAMVKPSIATALPNDDELNEDYSMQLELVIDSASTYGDTLGEANFSLYEITSQWNGDTFRYNSEVNYDNSVEVGSFTSVEDTIYIALSDDWKNRFAEYYNSDAANADSAFQYEFHGLALVAQNGTNRITYPRITSSRFLAINHVEPDTTSFSIRDWAYNLNRTGQDLPEDVSPIHSTLEGMLALNLEDFIEEFDNENFIRAEIVLYEAVDLLNDLPATQKRINVNSLNLDIDYEDDAEYEFQFGLVNVLGARDSSAKAFKFNVTSYLNNSIYGSENRRDLYIGNGSNSGILSSTAVYNNLAEESLRPKLIITKLTDDQE